MAHRHVDLTALARASFLVKLRRRRRSCRGHEIVSRHHGSELASAKRD